MKYTLPLSLATPSPVVLFVYVGGDVLKLHGFIILLPRPLCYNLRGVRLCQISFLMWSNRAVGGLVMLKLFTGEELLWSGTTVRG